MGLPYAFARLGWIIGIVVLVVFGLLSLYSGVLLWKMVRSRAVPPSTVIHRHPLRPPARPPDPTQPPLSAVTFRRVLTNSTSPFRTASRESARSMRCGDTYSHPHATDGLRFASQVREPCRGDIRSRHGDDNLRVRLHVFLRCDGCVSSHVCGEPANDDLAARSVLVLVYHHIAGRPHPPCAGMQGAPTQC